MGNEKKQTSIEKDVFGVGRDKGTPNTADDVQTQMEIDYICDPEEPSIKNVAERYDVNPSTAESMATRNDWTEKRAKRKRYFEDLFVRISDQIEERFKEVAEKNFRLLSEMLLRGLKRKYDEMRASDDVPSMGVLSKMQKMMRLTMDKSTEIFGHEPTEGWQEAQREIEEALDEGASEDDVEDVVDVEAEVVTEEEKGIEPGELE